MGAKKYRVSSGVSQLDRLLNGLFIGDNVVWYDDAGSLASVFCLNFMQVSQHQRKPMIYVSPESALSFFHPQGRRGRLPAVRKTPNGTE